MVILHKPNIHDVKLDNGDIGKRIVLGDWFDQGSVLKWQDGEYELQTAASFSKTK